MDCINNVFQNTRRYTTKPPKPKTVGGSAIISYVSDDFFYKLNLTNAISSLSLTPDVGNRFWNCHRGVEATNLYQFSMQYATFRSTQTTTGGTGFLPGNTGVFATTNRFAFYIRNNEFTNVRYAIDIPIISGTYNSGFGTVSGIYANNMAIFENKFGPQTFTSTAIGNNYLGDAITVSSPNSVSWVKIPNTGLSIITNTVDRSYRGINVSGMNSYSTSIISNTINLVDDILFNAVQHGIELTNTQNGAVIMTNTLSGVPTSSATNTKMTLVYVGGNTGVGSRSVTCNDLSYSYQGFEFNGPSLGTTWMGNLMKNHVRGMSLISNGRIGTQGGASGPSGNQWLGTSWSASNNGTYVGPACNATFSILYVQPSTPFFPPFPGGFNSFASYATVANTPTLNGSFSCGGGGSGNRLISSTSGRNVFTSTSSEPTTYSYKLFNDSTNEDINYIEKYNLYKTFDANDSLRNSDSANVYFYNSLANTSIAKFIEVDKYVYNNQLSNAMALRSSITATNNVEANYVQFYDLYNNFFSYDSLSVSDSTDLFTLTNLCPGIDGAVVYQARSLYNVIYRSIAPFMDNCDGSESSQRKFASYPVNSNLLQYSWDVKLYPNPAIEELNILCRNETENLELSIYDISGKLIQKRNLVITSFFGKLGLDLADGIYFISLTNQRNESITKKLVIAK